MPPMNIGRLDRPPYLYFISRMPRVQAPLGRGPARSAGYPPLQFSGSASKGASDRRPPDAPFRFHHVIRAGPWAHEEETKRAEILAELHRTGLVGGAAGNTEMQG